MIDRSKVIKQLQEVGIDLGTSVSFSPLTGGVSSDIWLIESSEQKFVIKQALPELKVADHWAADVKRNLAEQDFIHFVSQFKPEAVPQILLSDDAVPYFIMEYLGAPLQNWKTELLRGDVEIAHVKKAAALLAEIHNRSMTDFSLSTRFDHLDGFYALRLEPYLVTTGLRNPELANYFDLEVERLMKNRSALVHGDFSPKNILVSENRLVLLDHEVACWADPSFDVAFMINHLFLKLLYHRPGPAAQNFAEIPLLAWHTYFDAIEVHDVETLKTQSANLLLMLMLARLDGKSPVEYLSDEKRNWLRGFVYRYLPSSDAGDFEYLHQAFLNTLDQQ